MDMFRRSERPTIPPSFDIVRYAKDSDAEVAAAKRSAADPGEPEGGQPTSETRLVTHPKMGAVVTDEAWARGMLGAPVVSVTPEVLLKLPLDHRAGFLLSLMDGSMDLETLVELSAMARADTLRLVRDLFDSSVIAFR
jgi:hypothetical protein